MIFDLFHPPAVSSFESVLLSCLSATYCILIFADLWVRFLRPPWKETWSWSFGPICCLSACSVALWGFVFHNMIIGVEYSFFAAIGAYSWWNNHRQRRKRIAARVAARVKVGEGGLDVVPE